ncbi:mediator of RNA polymerase II transcription subunit 12-like [Achroia grisella]|uniref:mediator of RNA polymerase II transcription subunit 12-like n=1 Tax=Achroia grisella TaxID=688607 RepID=UPI0027D3129E|nr:mediator of RNA polymerase II transcription subunit 12-like [Achroia grisella]
MTIDSQNNWIFTWFIITSTLISISYSAEESKTEKPLTLEKKDEITPDVNSRFFDLSGLFNQLNPNFNQRPGGNTGPNLQSPYQFYPSGAQNGGFQQNPNQGNFNPMQNQGFNPQLPNNPNQWQGSEYPNQGSFQNPQLNGNNPNQQMGNTRPDMNNKGPSQFPSQVQGNILPPVSAGLHTQVQPNQWDQQQYLNQQRPIQDPDYEQNQYPNQMYQRPFNNPGFNNFPNGNEQNNGYQNIPGQQRPNFNQQASQYPNGGQGFQNPSQAGLNQGQQQGLIFNQQRPNQYPNSGNLNSGGTLDDIEPQYNGSQNAILGRPVQIPSSTFSPDQIYFEDSTESPSQRQCVQDCPATPEYQPGSMF